MKTILLLLFPFISFGQNIIPNSGFEDVTGCPGASVFLQNTNHWHRIRNHFGTPDQFHADCDYNGLVNSMAPGQMPYEGVGYAGLFCHGDRLREYMTVRLCEPMIKDSIYNIEFFILPATGYGTAINSFGVHFSGNEPKGVSENSLAVLQLEEHVGNPETRLILDTINWTSIKGIYKAKGGERYATFGNFRTDASTQSSIYKENCIRKDRSYMLIDGVSVSEDNIEVTAIPDDIVLDTFLLDPNFDERELKVRYQFETKKRELEFQFWDHLQQDGDTVLVVLNDTILVNYKEISKNKFKVTLDVSPGVYLLKLIAINLGDIPPNTCAMRVSDGARRRTFVLNSDLGSTEAIRIVVE